MKGAEEHDDAGSLGHPRHRQDRQGLRHRIEGHAGRACWPASARAPGQRRSVRREFGAAAYGSYEALAGDPDVDLVYVGTPHPMHYENALMALERRQGRAVRKAVHDEPRAGRGLVATWRARGNLFLMEAMWTRFMPALAEVQAHRRSGEIGAVHQVNRRFRLQGRLRSRAPPVQSGAGRRRAARPGHLSAVDRRGAARARDGGEGQAEMGPTGVDVQTAFTLSHEGGGRSRTPTELTISGTKGFVRLHDRFHNTETITVTVVDGASRSERTLNLPRSGNGYTHEAQEVGRCLRAGLIESPVMPHEETLSIMGTLDDIRAQIGLRYSADK
jgi:predicted dehydrogenase